MKPVIGSPFCAGAIALLMAVHVGAQSKSPEPGPSERWIATWAAAPQPARPLTAIRAANTSASTPPQANSGPRPSGPTAGLNNQTIRMVVHSSIGGKGVRIRLSNAYSQKSLRLGSAHIALRAKDSTIVPGSDRVLTFSKQPSFLIPPLAPVVSDAADLEVPPLTDLAISLYLPEDTGPATLHSVGLHTAYISKTGDATGQMEIPDATTSQSWFWLTTVEVIAPSNAAAVVAFGDSITDGTRSTPNTDSSWPAQLSKRLVNMPATAPIAVLNEGISANRVLQDGIGAAGLARFDRDVLEHSGVKWVTILEGINDIGAGIGEAFIFGPRPDSAPGQEPAPSDLIAAYRQMIERAHDREVKVIGCTLTPFKGAAYFSDHGNATRKAVNEWLRTARAFDAVVDFDSTIRDPNNPETFRAEFDSGDHLHPNDAGYKAMAQAVDVSIFKTSR